MARTKILAKIAILSTLGMILSMAGGCGGGGTDGSGTPPPGRGSEGQEQGRTEAYGKARTVSASASGKSGVISPQAAARRSGR